MTAIDPDQVVTETQAAHIITNATGRTLTRNTIHVWAVRGHIHAVRRDPCNRPLYRLGDITARRNTDTPPGRTQRIWLDDVLEMLDRGDPIDTIAHQLGVQPASIVRAATRHGTPTQRARIARARQEQADLKRVTTAAARTTRRNTTPARRTA